MKKRTKRRGFSLIELMVVLVISAIVVMAIYQVSVFVSRQVRLYVERYNMYSQLTYALDTMQTVMPTTIRLSIGEVKTVFSSKNDEKNLADGPFYFWGDSNPWDVTPEEFDDNASYTLEITSTGDLVLRKEPKDGPAETDVLIEGKFEPRVRMWPGEEPNFMYVEIAVKGKEAQLTGLSRSIVQVAGIRFWFVDVIQ